MSKPQSPTTPPSTASARTIVTWSIADLKEHPKQAAMFGDSTPIALNELAEDIKANGLREPPVILPDGTIVCGHRRVAAFELLGRTEVPVVVDDGLSEQGSLAVERRLIEDNLHRRHLDVLSIARCCKRLIELERGGSTGRLDAYHEGELRDHIGKRFNISGRTVSRYLRVLTTPIEVQHAVSSGRLALGDACRIAGLSKSIQTRIADEVHRGDTPDDVVKRHTAPKSCRHKSVHDASASFVRSIQRGLDDLEGRGEKVRSLSKSAVTTLRDARVVIDQLLALPQKTDEEADPFGELLGQVFDEGDSPDEDFEGEDDELDELE